MASCLHELHQYVLVKPPTLDGYVLPINPFGTFGKYLNTSHKNQMDSLTLKWLLAFMNFTNVFL